MRFDLLEREPSEKGAERLEKALALNADLAVAHTLKEWVTELWEQDDLGQNVLPWKKLLNGLHKHPIFHVMTLTFDTECSTLKDG